MPADVGADLCGLSTDTPAGTAGHESAVYRELQRFVLNYLVMHLATTSEPGLAGVRAALPLTTSKSAIRWLPTPYDRDHDDCPSDALIISAELTGMDAFEEVIKVEDIAALGDPLKGRLLEIARQQAPELV